MEKYIERKNKQNIKAVTNTMKPEDFGRTNSAEELLGKPEPTIPVPENSAHSFTEGSDIKQEDKAYFEKLAYDHMEAILKVDDNKQRAFIRGCRVVFEEKEKELESLRTANRELWDKACHATLKAISETLSNGINTNVDGLSKDTIATLKAISEDILKFPIPVNPEV